ncbi:ATP-binding protein [Levilactobacillus bambusae]|uniref:Carbamoyl phosphate synthase n=1 Tax=Levilactobacillus bambusae TaxID=2024736 RepID=A0A2V1N0S5_9LACO|nr:carbamoyl phosphate synthase [Levilactobacillus bambusae]PWG00859.1 carbamoyl phosphate synthase [Levilactobacillus bambusae]
MAIDLTTIHKVLIIGAGPTNIGHETELDDATVQTLTVLKKMGIQVLLIDNNPFSVALEETQPSNRFIQPVTTDNVQHIIEREQPEALIPSLGGILAIRITQELLENGVLADNQVQLLGMPKTTLNQINNPTLMNETLTRLNEPHIETEVVSTSDDALTIGMQIGYPLIVKPIASHYDANRVICDSPEDLYEAVQLGFSQSRFHQCSLEKSIVGYKEVEMVAVRDSANTRVLIDSIENVDSIGIHSGDSILVSPAQTLTDREYQRLRDATFKIAQALNIEGALHVQFALEPQVENYFITKISPYNNRGMALAARTTGYPVALVAANLIMGVTLPDIKLPQNYAKQTALMEPTPDHIVVRLPLWPFQDVPDADEHLDTVMKSVGGTVGVGRSLEEAILKGVRSSQFSPRDVLPSVSGIDDNELISQLIHPLANRVLVLIEALRRGYSVDELAEITRVDGFYFYKLKHLLEIEKRIQDHPMDLETLNVARYYGFGDGMIAGMWNVETEAVRQLAVEGGMHPTYKMIEPTAGEFDEHTTSFYSTFEYENESERLGSETVLVLGRGGNQLGPNTAADYFTTEMLKQLKRSGYRTIMVNTNPNSLSMVPEFSDKQYLDPIQLGDVLNIIDLEQPKMVIVPGNRHFLTRELKKRMTNIHVLPPDQETGLVKPSEVDVSVALFVTDHQVIPVGVIDMLTPGDQHGTAHVTVLRLPAQTQGADDHLVSLAQAMARTHHLRGMVQVLFKKTAEGFEAVGIRPTRLTEIAFLSKATGINWVRMLTRLHVGSINEKELARIKVNLHPDRIALMAGEFPFRQLRTINRPGTSAQEAGAALIFGSADRLGQDILADADAFKSLMNPTI